MYRLKYNSGRLARQNFTFPFAQQQSDSSVIGDYNFGSHIPPQVVDLRLWKYCLSGNADAR